VDPRSDVYSLALVLVECVTGEVPNAADTAIATLRARTASSIEADADRLGPLAPLIEAAGTAEVEPRWTAAQLGQALMRVAEQLPPPAPIPLAPPPVDQTVPDSGPATPIYVEPPDGLVLPTAEGTTAGANGAKGSIEPGDTPASRQPSPANPNGTVIGSAPPPKAEVPAAPSTPPSPPGPIPVAVPRPDAGADDDEDEDGAGHEDAAEAARGRRRRKRRFGPARIALVALVLVALGVLGALAAGLVDFDIGGPETHPVAGYVGSDLEAARARIEALDAGWLVEVEDGRAEHVPVNQVIEQRPAPGTELRNGATVVLVRSIGEPQVVVPALVGRRFDDPVVQHLFAEANLLVRKVDRFDENAQPGEIVAISQVAEKVDKGTTIEVAVSVGPQPRTLADYAGKPLDQAVADLTAQGLAPTPVEEASETVAKGNVIRTDPPAATQVPKGAPVNVVVSSGKPKLTVPDLTGYTGREAEDELTARGWYVSTIAGPSTAAVIGTDPPAGSVRDKGSPIRIFTQQN
jgi:serine/threonine-protein kinase